MAEHSRPKDGVASARLCPGIHVFGFPRPKRGPRREGLSHFHPSAKARRNPRTPESSMIPRYTRPEMASIWEAQTRFKIWFEIEAHAADALAELGVIPKQAAKT